MGQNLCGVILAAGESSRMGRDKALLPWPPSSKDETFLSAAIKLFFAHVDIVLVVAGRNQAELAPIIYTNGAALLVNPFPDQGQFSSLKVGLREVLNRGQDTAIFTLVDRPPVQAATIEFLKTSFAKGQAERKWAVVPEYGGNHGHPIVVGRQMLEAFLRAPETSNARDVEHQHQDDIEYVPVNDPATVMNVDTPEQYADLQSRLVTDRVD